jgi:putative transposase
MIPRPNPCLITRYRAPVIDELVEQRLKSVVAEVVAEKQACIVGIKVTADHLHLLVEVPPQLGVHRLVKAVKARSARVLRDEFPSLRSRLPSLWTNTYLVNTIGDLIPPATVQDFIEQQPGR